MAARACSDGESCSFLVGADIWYQTSIEDSRVQHALEVERIEKETQNKLGQLERRLRIELEGCKQELEDERKGGDPRAELMRDIDTSTRTLRTQAERRRKRLYGEGLEEEEDTGQSAGGGQLEPVGNKYKGEAKQGENREQRQASSVPAAQRFGHGTAGLGNRRRHKRLDQQKWVHAELSAPPATSKTFKRYPIWPQWPLMTSSFHVYVPPIAAVVV